jgi:DNA mismatch repair ATPase MutS
MGDVDETLDATFRVGAWIGQVTGDGGRRCGLAVLLPRARESMSDKRSCTLQLYDFVELDSYSNLESLLIQLQLSQLYLASGDANEAQKVAAVAEATNTPCEPAARALFSDTDVLQRIQALSGESAYPFEKDDLRLARLSCGCLLAKSRDLREAGEGAAVVERGALSSFMRLDMAAIRALNLLPSGRDEAVTSSSASGGSRLTSLWALLSNRCKTRAGRVTVRSWLLQPLVDTAVIEARLDVVEALMEHESLCSTWHAKVAMPDLDAYSSRLVSGRAGLADLVRLYAFIHGLPGLITMLESATGGAAPSVMAIEEEEEEGGGASSSSTSGPRASSGVPDKDLHPGMRTVRSAYLAPLRVQANDLVRLRSLVDTVLVDVTDVHHPRVKRGYKEELGELGEKLDEAEGAVEAVYSKAKR